VFCLCASPVSDVKRFWAGRQSTLSAVLASQVLMNMLLSRLWNCSALVRVIKGVLSRLS
jgi:hypothetical protein